MGGEIFPIFIGLSFLFDYDGSSAATLINVLQSTRNKCGKFIFKHSTQLILTYQIFCLFFITQLDGKNPSVDPSDEPDFYEQAIIPA